ncbi:MAG TPA: peptidylprolyl isomerase, partial [Pyrinomonadaceae bacterium]
EKCGTMMVENLATCPGCGAEMTHPAATEGGGHGVVAGPAPATDAPRATSERPGERSRERGAPPRRMKSATKALVAVALAVVACLGIIVWQVRSRTAHAALTSLTPEDMSLIAESLAPADRAKLAASAEERKKLAEDIKQILAVAAEAREKGVADRPEVKRQLEAMRMLVIAQIYVKKQRDANAKPEDYRPKQEEIDAFLKDPKNTQQADQYLEDLKKMGMVPEDQQITDEIKEQFRQQWAPMSLLAQKGRAAGVESERATHLQIQFQQSVALSRVYSNELTKKLEPTDEEIQAYYAAHPEIDPKATRQKAEDILQRARSGEDFDKLAKENSEEPGAKESGGDLGWFGRGRMVKPFEEAAFALKDNEISGIVESQLGYHIIQVLGHRTGKPEAAPGQPEDAAANKDAQPEEQIHARHILIKNSVPGANPFAPPKSARETAKEAIVEEKTKKIVDEIVKRTGIKVPEDFPVKAPETPQMPPGMGSPHGSMQPPPGGEEELPEAPPDSKPTPAKPPGGKKK